jgi:regulator of RNase E activity RraB
MIDEALQQWHEHTEQLIATLIEDGTNEEVHHTIEHHFSSVDFDTLEKAAITAFKSGFEIDETKTMFELAKKCKVDYDGWGTYFEE